MCVRKRKKKEEEEEEGMEEKREEKGEGKGREGKSVHFRIVASTVRSIDVFLVLGTPLLLRQSVLTCLSSDTMTKQRHYICHENSVSVSWRAGHARTPVSSVNSLGLASLLCANPPYFFLRDNMGWNRTENN